MKTIFAFLMLAFSITAFGQKTRPKIEFCPLCLVDATTFPTIQAGLELALNERFSFYNEVGIKYREGYFETADTSFVKSGGFKIKSELRYYFASDNQETKKTYVAANFFFNKGMHNAGISYYLNGDSSKLMIDNFGVKKSIAGMNVLVGTNINLRNRLSLNFYGGFGVRFAKINTTNKEFNKDKDELKLPPDLTISGGRDRADAFEKINSNANFTLGLRLCYAL